MDFLDPSNVFKAALRCPGPLKEVKGGSEWSNMFFQAEKGMSLVILTSRKPKTAPGR